MAVASKLLAVGTTQSSSPKLVYTVPPVHITIIKYISITNYYSTQNDCWLQITAGSGATKTWRHLVMEPYQTTAEDVWQVLPTNWQIFVVTNELWPIVYWVSGTELEGVNEIVTAPTADESIEPLVGEAEDPGLRH